MKNDPVSNPRQLTASVTIDTKVLKVIACNTLHFYKNLNQLFSQQYATLRMNNASARANFREES